MIIFFFLTFLINSASCYSEPNITTYYGNITGTNITVLGKKMTEYLGIPYAFPPIGNLRFKEPLEINHNHFNTTYFAVHLASACPQIIRVMNFSGYDDLNPTNGTSENCLKLNMWVPESNTSMPVLVFFHGGSWTVGSGSVDKFNGSVLALKTRSIVVVPNYRLGFFGFSYLSGENGISGNMGLLDQQMVLKWINRTIEDFNGNKSRVTIFGTDSGGSSVTAHLFSNNSRSLFKRGIVSSGIITHFMNTVSPIIAEINTLNVSVMVNCTNHTIFKQSAIYPNSSNKNTALLNFYYQSIIDKNKKNNTAILECLRNKTVTELLEAANKVRAKGQLPTLFPFAPINNDTIFFNGSIKDMFDKKKFNKKVDLIFGRTADEATYFMATGFTNNTQYNCSFYPLKPANATENRCIMNETNFLNLVDLGVQILNYKTLKKDNLTKIYNKTETTYTNKSIRLLSDLFFDCELSRFAMIYANVSKKNVYFYEYNRRSPINVWPPWTGAMHGDDLIAMFGIPFRHPEKYINITNVTLEQNYSDNVMWRIGNFTRKSNITSWWKKLNVSNPEALVFNRTLKDKSEPIYTNVTPPTCIELLKLIEQSYKFKSFLKKLLDSLKILTFKKSLF
uniref:Acetylcholinesterase n=2 Tax=Strongyloides stercoralis TaxID=6248 RepID=A0A0K0EB39_STRER